MLGPWAEDLDANFTPCMLMQSHTTEIFCSANGKINIQIRFQLKQSSETTHKEREKTNNSARCDMVKVREKNQTLSNNR
jgi:5-hydroxyisourate hydrolase-like protein (transthyretin family)